jgi:hypothetical protein
MASPGVSVHVLAESEQVGVVNVQRRRMHVISLTLPSTHVGNICYMWWPLEVSLSRAQHNEVTKDHADVSVYLVRMSFMSL